MNVARVRTASRPIAATIRPPGSKSGTIRALTCAALAEGRSHLYGPLDADDTVAMRSVLTQLGVGIDSSPEVWAIDGVGARLHVDSAVLDANESGLTARIALALAGSADGISTVTGTGRLPDRPFTPIVEALTRLGVEIEGERPPFRVIGHGPLWGGLIPVECSQSSQFATALMLLAPTMREPATIELVNLSGSQGYLEMTARMMSGFGAVVRRSLTSYEIEPTGYESADLVIEPDASSAVYPMVAAAITGGHVVIEGLAHSSQPDMGVLEALASMGCLVTSEGEDVSVTGPESLRPISIDMSGSPDGAVALVLACAHAVGKSELRGLASLRHKESDRIQSLTTELSRLGGDVELMGDTITIRPSTLRGARLDPHGDHRIAMSLALAGLTTEGVEMSTPNVVDKTWPEFWEVLDELAG